jgi:hypothetical protein
MRLIMLIPFLLAGAADARELYGKDARAIVRDGRVVASGAGDPPPWVNSEDSSPHLYLLVVHEDELYHCNIGASNVGNRAELACRKDAR